MSDIKNRVTSIFAMATLFFSIPSQSMDSPHREKLEIERERPDKPRGKIYFESAKSQQRANTHPMEDRSQIALEPFPFFAIYDGHNGYEMSEHLSGNLRINLVEMCTADGKTDFSDVNITQAFRITEQSYKPIKKRKRKRKRMGSTALAVFFARDSSGITYIYSAHTGDSRAVLGVNNVDMPFMELTKDHTLSVPGVSNEMELARIIEFTSKQRAQHKKLNHIPLPVDHSGNICKKPKISKPEQKFPVDESKSLLRANLTPGFSAEPAVIDASFWDERVRYPFTRCFGHPNLKKYGLTSDPEINRVKIDDTFQFIILGSDGLWDNISNHDAVAFVKSQLENSVPLEDIANNLLIESAANNSINRLHEIKDPESIRRNAHDDISVIIVRILH